MGRKSLIVIAGMIAVCMLAGCSMQLAFQEPTGAQISMKECFGKWSEPVNIPFDPSKPLIVTEHSKKEFKLLLPDGNTIYGTLWTDENTEFSKYGIIPIRLSQSEVIDPIVNEDKVVTYVVYDPSEKPEKKSKKGDEEAVTLSAQGVGTAIGEGADPIDYAKKHGKILVILKLGKRVL